MARGSNSVFHFKKFSIHHDKSVHKVGTDGVLLGAWATVTSATSILDIGTGTGVIALMLAQRTSPNVHIDALDISKDEVEQATENVACSPWANRIQVHHSSVQDFVNPNYHLIVSNPPFFINSAKPPSAERSRARHTGLLPLPDLISNSKRLLSPLGKLCVVLPPVEGNLLIALAEKHQLYCERMCEFKAREHKPVERLLLQFGSEHTVPFKDHLTLYKQGDEWTDEYKALTREFYLNI